MRLKRADKPGVNSPNQLVGASTWWALPHLAKGESGAHNKCPRYSLHRDWGRQLSSGAPGTPN